MNYIRKKLTIASILCFSLFQIMGCSSDKTDKKVQMPPLMVYVTNAEKKDFPYNWEFQAQTEGSQAVEVRSRVSGIIEERLYEEGAYVEQGQQLFQIERGQYEATVEQARADVYRTRREWERVLPLYKKNALSQKDRDNAKASYDAASASLKAAKINLNYCQVVSPVSGYSTQEELTVGNLVSNNSLLTKVNKTDPLYVNFAIANSFMQIVNKFHDEGRLVFPEGGIYDAKLNFIDGGEYDQGGKVTYISKQVEAMTGSIRARAEFVNEGGKILPGQFVRIAVSGAILSDAIIIPQSAVMMTQGANIVMVVDKDNKVVIAPIEILESIGDKYLIGKGLNGGERIIVEGHLKSRSGQVVNPVSIENKGKQNQQGEQSKAPVAQGEQSKSPDETAEKGEASPSIEKSDSNK